MPMSPRLLRPVASGVHPEAAAWRSAVVANGGSVSASTMKAVSTFCAAIDAAGIRDRFFRLNLFCGENLLAALVPLYRGPSRTGTQYGNATDTNNGPFVSGDYSEAAGLDGGSLTSGKYLDTGLSQTDIGTINAHMAFYQQVNDALTSERYMGAYSAGNNLFLARFAGSPAQLEARIGGTVLVNVPDNLAGLYVTDRESGTSLKVYTQGTERAVATTSTSSTLPTVPYFVFNNNVAGSPTANNYFSEALQAYSLGLSLGAAGVTSYTSAMTAFQTALGRNV